MEKSIFLFFIIIFIVNLPACSTLSDMYNLNKTERETFKNIIQKTLAYSNLIYCGESQIGLDAELEPDKKANPSKYIWKILPVQYHYDENPTTHTALFYGGKNLKNEITQNDLDKISFFVLYNSGVAPLENGICTHDRGTFAYHLAGLTHFESKTDNPTCHDGRLCNVFIGDLFVLVNDEDFNSRWIQKAEMKKQSILTLESFQYGENDPNCCPSEYWRFDIRLRDMKVIHKERLPDPKE